MAREKTIKYYVGDFETTVYDGQTDTYVWASGLCELNTEDARIFHSLPDTWAWIKRQRCSMVIYYHNLKFDGSFWLDMLLKDEKMSVAEFDAGDDNFHFEKPWKMKDNTYSYSVSDMGQWYNIKIKVRGCLIELRDSLKLLPFSVKKLGDAFKTKHRKLDMEYTGYRYPGCEITPAEREYLANDLFVVKECLEEMFKQGHTNLTIGSCALSEYKSLIGVDQWQTWYPSLDGMEIDKQMFGSSDVDQYIRRSYKGGWCYLVKGKENKLYGKVGGGVIGTTADVNSLYPSMMSSESGNRYPVGVPTFWKGNFIPDEALQNNRYYFIRIKTRFYLKPNMLPFIQIKGSWLYRGNDCLESSDIFFDGKYSPVYRDFDGSIHDTRQILTLTMTDYQLFREHYNVVDFEILDGCFFETEIGIFDKYIEKYRKMKMENKGALRSIAKLFLNSLYGKMASSKNSSFKVAYLKEDNSVGFTLQRADEKEAGYIAVGSVITSYARNFTIRAAQKNFHGKDKRGFIYADTDSIHCDLLPEEIKGITIHDSAFCCWKLESCFDSAIFVRQKTYIEHVTMENLKPVEPYYNIKCAGLPDRCKMLLDFSMRGFAPWSQKSEAEKEELLKDMDYDTCQFFHNLSEPQLAFLETPRTMQDFKVGIKIPGKLMPKRICGGVLLKEGYFEMLEK